LDSPGRTQAQPTAATAARARAERREIERARRRRGRRRLIALAIGLAVVGLGAIIAIPLLDQAVTELQLPLRHEDIIRQQAEDKRLDPAFIAAVIYAETKFRPRTSAADARGLMQILPATADFIAEKSGGTEFQTGDLADPQVNISYGSWYLRYLLDRYGNNPLLVAAAYNAGETNVDEWLAEHGDDPATFEVDDIPFPETRAYVERVIDAENRYREEYPKELGLD
jgi:soluble lytic murein transglycosylase